MQKTQKVVIAASFTAEPVREPIEFLLNASGIVVERVEFAPFNQIFQQLLDPHSLFSSNKRGINVLLLRLEDWMKVQEKHESGSSFYTRVKQSIERTSNELLEGITTAASHASVPFLLCLCPPSKSAQSDAEISACLDRAASHIAAELASRSDVYVVSDKDLLEEYPVAEYDDPKAFRLGHIPYTRDFFAALAAAIVRRIYCLQNPPNKVIVLDCDQTLWKGVCGEDGPLGIEIDSGRWALQEFMVRKQDEGMLLCLASRNNEQDVFDVFDQRPEMPLKREHIVAYRINWGPKSDSLKALADELNLGLESFIFVDDDPAVCAEVEANCPQVLSLQLPAESSDIPQFLKHIWAFDQLRRTSEDGARTRLYKENLKRKQLQGASSNLAEFLSGLELVIEVAPLRKDDIARVAQLTQRTNQFNFTSIRRSEQEIQQLIESDDAECLVARVSDRFGDYGLVGVAIFRQKNIQLEVETFLLSCRALGRGVEHKMFSQLGECAQSRGLESVVAPYVRSTKNQPAYEFLCQLRGERQNSPNGEVNFVITASDASSVTLETAACLSTEAAPEKEYRVESDSNTSLSGESTKSAIAKRIVTEFYNVQKIVDAIQRANVSRREERDVSLSHEPQDKVELKLKQIWEELLNICPIGVCENYFELGGDSITAVQVFCEIETHFGKHLPLTTLLAKPTIRQIAAIIRSDERKERWSALVPIQPEGQLPPFYCMHAAGGNVLFYKDLAKHLRPEQPLYGLQARGMDRSQTHHNRVEDMASFYIQEIQSFQPNGPYYLGGSSFGGLVAFEMARQLEKQGETVALLALFDTYGPGYPRPLKDTNNFSHRVYRVVERVQNVKDKFGLLNARGKIGYLKEQVGKARNLVRRRIAWKQNEIAIKFSQATGRPLPKDLQRNQKAILEALHHYQPGIYGGRLTLFRASRQPKGIQPDETLGWKGYARGGLDICEVPGSHGMQTVDPHARFLAEKLRPYLVTAQSGSMTENAKRARQNLGTEGLTGNQEVVLG